MSTLRVQKGTLVTAIDKIVLVCLTFLAIHTAQWTHIDGIGRTAANPQLPLCIVVGYTAGHIASVAGGYEANAGIVAIAVQHQRLLLLFFLLMILLLLLLWCIASTAHRQTACIGVPRAAFHALCIAEAERAVSDGQRKNEIRKVPGIGTDSELTPCG